MQKKMSSDFDSAKSLQYSEFPFMFPSLPVSCLKKRQNNFMLILSLYFLPSQIPMHN